MNNNHNKKFRGVVVPMVTPTNPTGSLDEPAAGRLIDSLLRAGVDGVFVLGTTGEAASVPRSVRMRLVEYSSKRVNGKVPLYAGINDNCLRDVIETGNQYLRAGADAVVALPPSYFPIQRREMLQYFSELLDQMNGPVILYNMPSTTHLSIPIEVIEELVGHPRLAGLKDSEDNGSRLEKLVRQLGSRADFSIFIGVGTWMAKMLPLGADGIVPSAGNLAPGLCCRLYERARAGHQPEAEQLEQQLSAVVKLYQRGRTLGESLAALKAAMSFRGLCQPDVFPPLLPLSGRERNDLGRELARLDIPELLGECKRDLQLA